MAVVGIKNDACKADRKAALRPTPPRRPVVLTFVDYYLPGYKAGGPVTTVSNMASRLSDVLHFRIATRDRDLGDTAPYAAAAQSGWQPVGHADVCYVPSEGNARHAIARLLAADDYHLLYLNSLFSPLFSIWPLMLRRLGRGGNRPVIVAPRGELYPGALQQRRIKKTVFLQFVRAVQLHGNVCWHASSQEESELIRQWFGRKALVRVAPNLTSVAPPRAEPSPLAKPAGSLKILFLSRIDPKKNLLLAIERLHGLTGDIEMTVHGPVGDREYWNACCRRAAQLPSNVRFVNGGALAPDQIEAAIRRHHLLLLPTLGENFGHVILETLRAGRPVLISDRTPWRGLADFGCGWDLPLSAPHRFTEILQQLVDADRSQFEPLCRAATGYAARICANDKVIEDNRRLFVDALAAHP